MPSQMISDRDPRFLAEFTSTVFKALNIHPTMSTTDHPETNGLQERMFRTFNHIMRSYVNVKQDDWEMYIPIVEFNMNSIPRKQNKLTPFQIDLGYQPTLTFASALLRDQEKRSASAEQLIELFEETDNFIRETIAEVRQYQKQLVDSHRTDVQFQVGEFVMVTTKNIAEFHNKLAPRWLGPVRIIAKLPHDVYTLALPPRFSKVHPNFHVSKLKRAPAVPSNPSHTPIEFRSGYVDPLIDDTEPEIDKIVDHKHCYNKLVYRVRYKNRLSIEDVWIREDLLPSRLIDEYKQIHRLSFPVWFSEF